MTEKKQKQCVDCGQLKDRLADFKPRWAGCVAHKNDRGRRKLVVGCDECAAVVNGDVRQPRCIDCDRKRRKGKPGGLLEALEKVARSVKVATSVRPGVTDPLEDPWRAWDWKDLASVRGELGNVLAVQSAWDHEGAQGDELPAELLRAFPNLTCALIHVEPEGSPPEALEGFETLEKLEALSFWVLRAEGHEAVFELTARCASLRWLELDLCEHPEGGAPATRAEAVAALARLDRLERLQLVGGTFAAPDGNPMDQVASHLAGLERLRSLVFNGCEPSLSDAGVERLADRLQRLRFAGDPGADEVLGVGLLHAAALTALELRGAPISRRGWDAIGQLVALTRLDLGQGKPGVPVPSLRALSALRSLDVSGRELGWQRFAPSFEDGLATLKRLTVLNLARCDGVSAGALEAIAGLSELEELDLEGVEAVTDEVVASLARLPRLQCLRLDGCKRVTGASLDALVAAGALKTLSMKGCDGVEPERCFAVPEAFRLRVAFTGPDSYQYGRVPEAVSWLAWELAASLHSSGVEFMHPWITEKLQRLLARLRAEDTPARDPFERVLKLVVEAHRERFDQEALTEHLEVLRNLWTRHQREPAFRGFVGPVAAS